MENGITDLLDELGAEKAEALISWKKQVVFNPIYKEVPAIGVPVFILFDGKKYRLSTEDESFEIMSVIDYDKDEE